jgi:hypothetical protein
VREGIAERRLPAVAGGERRSSGISAGMSMSVWPGREKLFFF